MATTNLGDVRYPVGADVPNIAQYFQNLATDVSSQIVPRFANATERDSDYAAWASATGLSLVDGMVCSVAGRLQQRFGGAWVQVIGNAGTAGVHAGTAAPPGQPLLEQTYRGNLVTNGSGDATLTYPSAFPNGVQSVQAIVASANPIYWTITGGTLSTASLRAYTGTTPAASLSILSLVLVKGW